MNIHIKKVVIVSLQTSKMNLKCEEELLKRSPCSLQRIALAAWINGRKNWDPELGLHLCKVSKSINDIVFDCDPTSKFGGIIYTYVNLKEIIEFEKKKQGVISSSTLRWYTKTKRAMVTVKLQDEIEMDKYPYKKKCRRLFTD